MMVSFGNFYTIDADEVVMVKVSEGGDTAYPYHLTVFLRNGQSATVSYKTKEARNDERQRFHVALMQEKHRDYERLYNKLYLLENAVSRIDRRQLRIWRILSKLLNIEEKVDHDD